MLSIFKSHYYLKDIIPQNYIDIHNHILPAIDDGAKTIQDTKILISHMKKINISGAIATPHTSSKYWNNTSQSIINAFCTVIESNADKSFLKGYASEYMLDIALMDRLKKEKLLCIMGSYVLIEFSLLNCPINLYEMLFQLKCRNYKIILAHPERYLYFHNDIEKFEKLKDFGVYFQLNLLSLTGYYGKNIQKTAEYLIEKDFYDFTGTDIHNVEQANLFSMKFIHFKKNKISDLLQKNTFLIPSL